MLRIGDHILPKNSNPDRDCRSVETDNYPSLRASRQGCIPDGICWCRQLKNVMRNMS